MYGNKILSSSPDFHRETTNPRFKIIAPRSGGFGVYATQPTPGSSGGDKDKNRTDFNLWGRRAVKRV